MDNYEVVESTDNYPFKTAIYHFKNDNVYLKFHFFYDNGYVTTVNISDVKVEYKR